LLAASVAEDDEMGVYFDGSFCEMFADTPLSLAGM
jgi:hypothetical protein